MINALVIVTFLSCFLAAFFAKKLNVVSVYFVVLPELLSGIVLLVVIARLIVGKRLELDGKYIVFIVALLMTMAMGAVVEGVPAGPVVSGLRTYLPALPLLLLGAVYPFKGREIRSQLVVLIALLAIQIPLAVYQRFWQFAHKMHTGDVVTGTVTNSGVLSVVMISGITLLTVLYLRRKLSLLPYLTCTGLMLVPTAVNETKATIVMLPVAMFAPILLMRRSEQPLRRLVPIVAIFTICGAGFVATYDYLIQNRASGTTLEDFWLEGRVQDYMYRGAVEGDPRVGRFDSMQIAVRTISQTPLRAVFGLGIGNVSPAMLPGFEGEYAHYYEKYRVWFTQVTMLLWNMGFAGVAVYGLLLFAMLRDAVTLAKAGGSHAAIGQCWGAIVVLFAMSFLYHAVLAMNEIMFPLMFYAGFVARRAHLLRREHRALRRAPARAPQRGGPKPVGGVTAGAGP
ncbi:MAG: hypothetical protein LOD94_05010 [Gammaproteobacteria bacterium]|nr:hypothetical protein [Gammaproteobacteria bacterium]